MAEHIALLERKVEDAHNQLPPPKPKQPQNPILPDDDKAKERIIKNMAYDNIKCEKCERSIECRIKGEECSCKKIEQEWPIPPYPSRQINLPGDVVPIITSSATPVSAGEIDLSDLYPMFRPDNPYRMRHMERAHEIFFGKDAEDRKKESLRRLNELKSRPPISLNPEESAAIIDTPPEEYMT